MPISESRKQANKKWNDANLTVKYDHIHVVAPKGLLPKLKSAAKTAGSSVNSYIITAILEKMQKEKQE